MSTANTYRPSSELHRCAVEVLRNEDRAKHWRARYTLATGHEPVHCLHPVLNAVQAARLWPRMQSNLGRLRMPHHRGQMGINWPAGFGRIA